MTVPQSKAQGDLQSGRERGLEKEAGSKQRRKKKKTCDFGSGRKKIGPRKN